MQLNKRVVELTPKDKVYAALKKINPKWEWEPKTGDIFEYRWQGINTKGERVWHKEKEVVPFIFQIWGDEDGRYMAFGKPRNYRTARHYFLPNCIPILRWEKIIPILRVGYDKGYVINVTDLHYPKKCSAIVHYLTVDNPKGEYLFAVHDKSFQLAVIQAVIKLGDRGLGD